MTTRPLAAASNAALYRIQLAWPAARIEQKTIAEELERRGLVEVIRIANQLQSGLACRYIRADRGAVTP